MVTKKTWVNGARLGVVTSWKLGKIIFPVTFFVTLLQFTPVMEWIARFFAPLMKWFGLPGEAAVVLVLGNLLPLYAPLGAMLTMDLTVKEVFIMAVMLSFSHSLIIETAMIRQMGVKGWIMVSIRLGLAMASALAIRFLWDGGQEKAQYGLMPEPQEAVAGWGNIIWHAAAMAAYGLLQVAVIVFALMLAIQLLKDSRALDVIVKALSPFNKLLGTSGKSGLPLMAGLLFGIAYGAGVMIQAVQEDHLSKKDVYLVSVFLVTFHSVFEDHLIFLPLGVNIFWLIVLRFVLAVIITASLARLWKEKAEHRSLPESPAV